MPRKKKGADVAPQTDTAAAAIVESTETSTATAQRPAYIDGPPTTATGEIMSVAPGPHEGNGTDETHGKNWGPPYKAIFTSSAKGFEMGENRRFKQRVFKFTDKPDTETLAALKDNGFTYRPEEKAWTIHADAESRLLTDRLALQFAAGTQEITR
jgi:hypothetical protein